MDYPHLTIVAPPPAVARHMLCLASLAVLQLDSMDPMQVKDNTHTVILIILIVHVHTSFVLVLLAAEFHAFYQSARVDGVVASSVG